MNSVEEVSEEGRISKKRRVIVQRSMKGPMANGQLPMNQSKNEQITSCVLSPMLDARCDLRFAIPDTRYQYSTPCTLDIRHQSCVPRSRALSLASCILCVNQNREPGVPGTGDAGTAALSSSSQSSIFASAAVRSTRSDRSRLPIIYYF